MFNRKSLTAILSTVLATTALGAVTTASASAETVRYAHTPSGNITCKATLSYSSGWSLVCSVADPGQTFRITTGGYAYESGYKRIAKRGRSLYYGGIFTLGDFRCESQESGLTCSRNRDEGFVVLSRDDSSATN